MRLGRTLERVNYSSVDEKRRITNNENESRSKYLNKMKCSSTSENKPIHNKRKSVIRPSVRGKNGDEESICRICRTNDAKVREKLISPCLCKGTLAYIHRTCLEKWLKRSGTLNCELCGYKYAVKIIRRYSKFDSVRKWLTDENSADDAQDLIIDGILALTFLPIVFLCCHSFVNVYTDAHNTSISAHSQTFFQIKRRLWLNITMACTAMATVTGYFTWVILRSVHYHKRWRNWQRRHGKLILIVDEKN